MGRRTNIVTQDNAVENEINPAEDIVEDDGIEVEQVEDADVLDEVDVSADDEVEDVSGAEVDNTEKTDKPVKETKPKRGDLPEGLVTPVQLAKELSKPLDGNAENLDDSNYRYTHSKNGSHVVVPQMVYSYLKGAGGKNPLELRTVVDSEGTSRDNIMVLTDALAWWDAKNARAAASKATAQEKAAKKAAKGNTETASSTDAATEGADAGGEVEEAE
jgi:hypothetical protein